MFGGFLAAPVGKQKKANALGISPKFCEVFGLLFFKLGLVDKMPLLVDYAGMKPTLVSTVWGLDIKQRVILLYADLPELADCGAGGLNNRPLLNLKELPLSLAVEFGGDLDQ